MSDVVKDITLAFESQIAIILPTYKELDFKYDVTKNNYYNNSLRYGVIPSGGFNTPTTTKAVTISQTFTLILTNEYINSNDTDSEQQEAIFELYNQLNEVYKIVVKNKLGLAAQVYDVSVSAIEAPLFIDESKVAILNTDFIIQYRTQF